VDPMALADRAAALSDTFSLHLRTPLHIKSRGSVVRTLDPTAMVRAASRRIAALALFHGGSPWTVDHRELVACAHAIRVDRPHVTWVNWTHTPTQHGQPCEMTLGGLVGTAALHSVPPQLRAVLLLGSVVHIGKSCVFGHGCYELQPCPPGGIDLATIVS